MTDYRRNFTAGGSFFFERLQDVQQGDGFRKAQPILRALTVVLRAQRERENKCQQHHYMWLF